MSWSKLEVLSVNCEKSGSHDFYTRLTEWPLTGWEVWWRWSVTTV